MSRRILKSGVFLFAMVLTLTLITVQVFAKAEMSPAKEYVSQWVGDNQKRIIGISDAIWSYAELGWQEFKSSQALKDWLKENGFKVEGVEGLPTAIDATYGSGKPVIGFIGEYDALPMLSQKAGVPYKDPVVAMGDKVGPGHGCG